MLQDQAMKVKGMEAELRMYWEAMKRGWELYEAMGPEEPELELIREEIDAIAMHTDWVLLRQMCQRAVALDERLRVSVIAEARRAANG